MYDLDDDFSKSYDANKAAANTRIPFFPFVEGTFQAILQRVTQDKSKTKGKYFQFLFLVTKSSNDAVLANKTYIQRFNQGASDVDNEICWRNMLPILMAAKGVTDILSFNAPEALGELLSLSKELDLDLPMSLVRQLEACKPDKLTGKVKHVNEDGTPKKFPRDQFSAA